MERLAQLSQQVKPKASGYHQDETDRMRPKSQYLLSLPERLLRSASALAAGLVREIGNIALPKRVRRTRLYQTMVETTLRFLIEQVGQVEGSYPAEGKLAEKIGREYRRER